MMNADPNRWGKYRIPTARKVGNDYTAGAFFITWCVSGRIECLAHVESGRSIPTAVGAIVDGAWHETATVRPSVTLDAWIVMPDHVHGIMIIRPVEPAHRAGSTRPSRLWAGSLGAIVGQIKSIATKRIRAAGYPEFEWQDRFHDRILRDEKALMAARQYILDNPAEWERHRDNPDGPMR